MVSQLVGQDVDVVADLNRLIRKSYSKMPAPNHIKDWSKLLRLDLNQSELPVLNARGIDTGNGMHKQCSRFLLIILLGMYLSPKKKKKKMS